MGPPPDDEWKRRVEFLREVGATAATFSPRGDLLRIELGPQVPTTPSQAEDPEKDMARLALERRVNAAVAEERRMRILRGATSQLRGTPILDGSSNTETDRR